MGAKRTGEHWTGWTSGGRDGRCLANIQLSSCCGLSENYSLDNWCSTNQRVPRSEIMLFSRPFSHIRVFECFPFYDTLPFESRLLPSDWPQLIHYRVINHRIYFTQNLFLLIRKANFSTTPRDVFCTPLTEYSLPFVWPVIVARMKPIVFESAGASSTSPDFTTSSPTPWTVRLNR